MKTTVRPMAAGDKPAVTAILQGIREFSPEEVLVAEELIDAYLEDPSHSDYLVLVAETDGLVSGYTCYGPTPLTKGTWDIYWVAVDPGIQGHGVGRALMALTERRIREKRGRLIMVETSGRPDYARTRRFYESLHYREAARIADFYAPRDDKVVLEKRLQETPAAS